MDWLQAIALGLAQGLTEFIPVSSTAHLRIVPALLGWNDPGTAFSAVIQLGTLLAVFIYFAGDIRRLATAAILSLFKPEARRTPDALLAWRIAAGNVPIIVLGLGFRDFIENQARSLYVIGVMLILLALGLAAAELMMARRGKAPRRNMESLGLGAVLVVGLWQALALIPGTSRSGATLLGGLLAGISREEAARFSFLLGIPAIFGSGLFQIPPLLEGISQGRMDGSAVVLGLAAAALSGYASIAFLLRYLKTHTTLLFVFYRIVLGGVVLALALGGAIR
ncbi:MAG: undecaprenyl-diphosphatase UppP [Deltaproteobacteria bacterium]|nr:undecaprenyl-diphosphatase UppP [Deltaproteobacteria bacterium]